MRETHIVGDFSREWLVPTSAELAYAGLLMVGISDAHAPFRFVRVTADYPQLLACYSGQGRVFLDGRWRTCRTGSAYISPAARLHAYHAIEGEPWKLCWILYYPGAKCPIKIPAPALINLDPRPIHSIIRGMYRESVSRAEPASMLGWIGLLQLYADRALRESGAGDTLWPIWKAITTNLSHDWTATEMAEIVSISTEHLRRLCLRQLHCTPMQRLTHLRMQHAATLLRGTPQKIDAIAVAVGYANRFAFSNAFKRKFGLTPVEYRRRE